MQQAGMIELSEGLLIQQFSGRDGSGGYIEVRLVDRAQQVLSASRLQVYGGPAGLEEVLLSPDKKMFAVFSRGNTGFEESISYCAVFQVEARQLRRLYLEEKVGGSKYRWESKACVSFPAPGQFEVTWEDG